MTSTEAAFEVEARVQEPELSRSRTSQLQKYFGYDGERDKPSHVCTALLTVAVLIPTATYQAVVSPPGGVWQENKKDIYPEQVAGKSIMGTNSPISYGIFLVGNTLGFLFSFRMIEFLTFGFPLRLELRTTLFTLSFTYGLLMGTISPSGAMAAVIFILSLIFVIILPFLARKCSRHSS